MCLKTNEMDYEYGNVIENEGLNNISCAVTPSGVFIILQLTTVHENAGRAGILPAVARHRALDEVAGRMPALPFPWQRGISP
jgi:hypothetical protein